MCKIHFRLVRDFNEIHRFSIFAFFIWAVLGVCNIFLTLQFQLVEKFLTIFWFFISLTCFIIILKMDQKSKMIDIITNAVIAVLTFVFLFIACEPGERVTEAFEQFDDELIQCNWYTLPIGIQRLYSIFLVNTQQSINIQCYGEILCTRETSKNVILHSKQRLAYRDLYRKPKFQNLIHFFSQDNQNWAIILYGTSPN